MPTLTQLCQPDDGGSQPNDKRLQPVNGDTSADDKRNRRRDAAQQAFLKELRRDFVALVTRNPKDTPTISTALARLGGVTHKDSWNNLQPFFGALRKVPDAIPLNGVIVLGGWMLPPPKDLTDGIIPAPNQLVFDLLSLGLFSEVLARFDQHWKHGHDEVLRKAYTDLVDQYKAVFAGQSPSKVAEEQVATLLPGIRRAFHFMENKAFAFSAIPGHPLRGWEDFLTFAHAYDALPPLQRITFGPYYFSFHVPSP